MLSDITAHRVSQQYSADTAGSLDVIARTTVQGQPGGFAVNSIRHFADCVINDTEPVVTGEDGLRNTEVLVAIHESARTGQPVDIE
jgi:predicted dehydrogenase